MIPSDCSAFWTAIYKVRRQFGPRDPDRPVRSRARFFPLAQIALQIMAKIEEDPAGKIAALNGPYPDDRAKQAGRRDGAFKRGRRFIRRRLPGPW